MPDVVGRNDRANLARAVPRQSTGMAAIEDGNELRGVG
jgi:hypothetical protein